MHKWPLFAPGQDTTEGLASYHHTGVWRTGASPQESLDTGLLVEMRQDESELSSSLSRILSRSQAWLFCTKPFQVLCSSLKPPAQCCLRSPRAFLTSAYYCFSKLSQFRSSSCSKTFFSCLTDFRLLYPLNCEETHRLKFFFPLAVTIPLFLCLFLSSVLTKASSRICISLPASYLTVHLCIQCTSQ